MSSLIIVQPLALAAANVSASRGTGPGNLATRDPKEVWADSAVGAAATLTVDLGAAKTIDTILLGYLSPPAAGATWSITGGTVTAGDAVIQAATALRVPDVAGDAPAISHALWRGASRTVRYLAISVTQPAGSATLTAGVLVVGAAFVASLGQEWGGGRQPIDTGTATALPDGGFAVVEGVRKKAYSWTFGDLSIAETEQLDLIAGQLGDTAPALVIEDPDVTAGLRRRIHYGLIRKPGGGSGWSQYERRNRQQTRWELTIEEWV